MDSGFYAACAALVARTEALDSIANNLANSSTGGYRARHNSFGSVLAGSAGALNSKLNEAMNSYGIVGGSRLDRSQGALTRTGGEFDIGLDGPGFLAVQTAGGEVYTRSGNLTVSPEGQLTTASGDPVLGEGGPITVPAGSKTTISPDGTVSTNGAVAGKLKLVEFADNADVQGIGTSYYGAPANDVLAATHTSVRQGMVEGSNVSPVSSVIELINAQRAAESMRHALSMIDTEMDKTASQELSRVG